MPSRSDEWSCRSIRAHRAFRLEAKNFALVYNGCSSPNDPVQHNNDVMRQYAGNIGDAIDAIQIIGSLPEPPTGEGATSARHWRRAPWILISGEQAQPARPGVSLIDLADVCGVRRRAITTACANDAGVLGEDRQGCSRGAVRRGEVRARSSARLCARGPRWSRANHDRARRRRAPAELRGKGPPPLVRGRPVSPRRAKLAARAQLEAFGGSSQGQNARHGTAGGRLVLEHRGPGHPGHQPSVTGTLKASTGWTQNPDYTRVPTPWSKPVRRCPGPDGRGSSTSMR